MRQISDYLCRAIDIIGSELDTPDRKLKFFTDARARFKRMEPVLYRLCQRTLSLALEADSNSKGFIRVSRRKKLGPISFSYSNFRRPALLFHSSPFRPCQTPILGSRATF